MSYEAEISRNNPTAFLFLIDQSGSMGDPMPATGKSKAEFVADVLNRTLANMIIRCSKQEGVRNYFEVGAVVYGVGSGVGKGFQGAPADGLLPIADLESAPLRIEERTKKEPDGAGGIIETATKFPVWFEPKAEGGTPMRQAITEAAKILAPWCDAHPDSYPPTVLHVTDGESTDGNPEELARQLAQLHTNDGNILLFNLHVEGLQANPITFPAAEQGLPGGYAGMLFRMSSELPSHLVQYAQDKGFAVSPGSRGYVFNADAVEISEFFDIGTRAANLR